MGGAICRELKPCGKRSFLEVRSNFSLVIYEIYTVMFHRPRVSSLVKNSAGSRQLSVVKTSSCLSNRIPSYFSILESVSHLPIFWWRIALPWCGVLTITFAPPNVHFLLSLVNIAMKSYDQPMTNQQHIKKQRHYFANKSPSSQSYGFPSGHVWM